MLSRSFALLFTAVSASACYGAGLTATAGTPVETTSATVDVGPGDVDVQAAPQVQYEGRPTYYYRDHWYYRDGNRWQYYRSEPNVLLEQRRRFQVNRGGAVNVAPRQDKNRRDFDREHEHEHDGDRRNEGDHDRR